MSDPNEEPIEGSGTVNDISYSYGPSVNAERTDWDGAMMIDADGIPAVVKWKSEANANPSTEENNRDA